MKEFTRIQREIIAGSMLGDGSIEARGPSARLQIKQAERYGQYVQWLYQYFQDFCNLVPKQRQDTRQWYFATRYESGWLSWHKLFYSNGRKFIPSNIGGFLTPLSIAVWYMDDGTLDYRVGSHCACSLIVNCFKRSEVELLQYVLREKFGVISSIQNPLCRGKRYLRLYVGRDGRETLLRLIKPHIIDCFKYKLPPSNLTPQRLIRPHLLNVAVR